MEGWGRIDEKSSNSSKKPSSLFASWQRLWSQLPNAATTSQNQDEEEPCDLNPSTESTPLTTEGMDGESRLGITPVELDLTNKDSEDDDSSSSSSNSSHSKPDQQRPDHQQQQRQPPSFAPRAASPVSSDTTQQASQNVEEEEDGLLSPVSTPVSTPQGTPHKQFSHYLSYRGSLLDRVHRMVPPSQSKSENPAAPPASNTAASLHDDSSADSTSTAPNVRLMIPSTPVTPTSTTPLRKNESLPFQPAPPPQASSQNPLYPKEQASPSREDEEDEIKKEEEVATAAVTTAAVRGNEPLQVHQPIVVSKLQPRASSKPDFSKNLFDPPSPRVFRKPPTPSLFCHRSNPMASAKILGIALAEEEGNSLEISDSDMYTTEDREEDEAENPMVPSSRNRTQRGAGEEQLSIVGVASISKNDSTDNGTVDTAGRSLSTKLQHFFKRVKRYEAFANMEDQEMMEKNYCVSFSSTDVDDDHVTLSTNASSALIGTSALARHLKEQAQKADQQNESALDDTMTDQSYPLAETEHITPSLVFFDQSTVTEGTDSDGGEGDKNSIINRSGSTGDEPGLQLNVVTGGVDPVIHPDDEPSPNNCSMSTSFLIQVSNIRTADSAKDLDQLECKAVLMKTNDRAPMSLKVLNRTNSSPQRDRHFARCIIRVSAIVLLAACIVVLVFLLTKRFQKDGGSGTDASGAVVGSSAQFNSTNDESSPAPTAAPSEKLTLSPSSFPSSLPTTKRQTITSLPSTTHSSVPSSQPSSNQPTSHQPTSYPPTSHQPTSYPPTSHQPTSRRPTSSQPTSHQPTRSPDVPTMLPKMVPSPSPTVSSVPTQNFADAERLEQVVDIISTRLGVLGGENLILVEGTDQYNALQWLLSDPKFETYSNETIAQRYGLAVLLLATGGRDRRMLYVNDGNLCSWTTKSSGPICEEGKLRILDWSNSGLTNSIPVEIGLLVDLKEIHLSGNSLVGGLPESIGLLKHLEVLKLQGNYLRIALPEALADCKNLVDLDLSNNEFATELPSVLSELRQLRYLRLADNYFFGPIPDSYYELVELEVLDMSKNRLDGGIGSGIRGLIELGELYLSSNLLSFFAEEIGYLAKLRVLDLRDNRINHAIPITLSLLANAQSILLGNNLMTGEIPNFSPLYRTLEHLDLSYNDLEGYIPYTLGYCVNLRTLLLNSNNLWGGIDDHLKNLGLLEVFRVDNNDLYRKVPKGVCARLPPGIDFRADCIDKLDCRCCSMCCEEDECHPNVVRKLSSQRPSRLRG